MNGIKLEGFDIVLRDLWASMQKTQSAAAAFREVFANPEGNARAAKR